VGNRDDDQDLTVQQVNEWKAQTERFNAQSEQKDMQARQQYERNLEMSHARYAPEREHLDEPAPAVQRVWLQLKWRMDKAGGELKMAMEQLMTIFKP